jgi:hypothetical protein
LKRYQRSYDATKEAVNIYPELDLAHYHHSRYCARLCRIEEALKHLRIAIYADRFYCLKVDSDKDFSNKDFKRMSDELNNFFKDLQIEADINARKELTYASNLIDNALLHGVADETQSLKILESSKKKLNEGKELIIKKTYFSSRDAIYKAYTSQKLAVDSLINYINIKIYNLKIKQNNLQNSISTVKVGEHPLSKGLSEMIYVIVLISFIHAIGGSYGSPFLFFVSLGTSMIIFQAILKHKCKSKYKSKINVYKTQLMSIEEDLHQVLKAKDEAAIEKEKLYIDNSAENRINAEDYEEYLIKKFR